MRRARGEAVLTQEQRDKKGEMRVNGKSERGGGSPDSIVKEYRVRERERITT